MGLPNGDDYYKHRLKIYTTTNYTPDEIHDIGLEMVDTIQEEILKILASEGYNVSKNLISLYEELNNDKRFLFEDSDKGRQEILDRYTQIQTDALEKMSDHFHDLPKSEVIVKEFLFMLRKVQQEVTISHHPLMGKDQVYSMQIYLMLKLPRVLECQHFHFMRLFLDIIFRMP